MHIFEDNMDILQSMSEESRRYYGYAVVNLTKMIEIESSKEIKTKLFSRKDRISLFLRKKTGYTIERHSVASTKIINKHGLLKIRDSSMMNNLNAMNPDAIKSAIVRLSDSEEFLDILTLYQSLREL